MGYVVFWTKKNRHKRFSWAFWRVRRSYSRWYNGGTEEHPCLGSFISKKRRAASKYVKSKELRPCVSGSLKARKNGFGERFQVPAESDGRRMRLAALS